MTVTVYLSLSRFESDSLSHRGLRGVSLKLLWKVHIPFKLVKCSRVCSHNFQV